MCNHWSTPHTWVQLQRTGTCTYAPPSTWTTYASAVVAMVTITIVTWYCYSPALIHTGLSSVRTSACCREWNGITLGGNNRDRSEAWREHFISAWDYQTAYRQTGNTHYSGFPLVTFTVPCDSVNASNKLQQANVYVYTYVCTCVYIGSMHTDKTIA